METCGMSCIKYLLFIFNLVFSLSGIGIIIAGAVVLADVSDFTHFVSGDLLGPPIVLIVAGAIVFVIAFLGCFGAIRESYRMLIGFAVLLLVIFIVELAVGISAAVYKADFQQALKSGMKESIQHYNNQDSNSDVKISWDNLHKKLKCCGVEGSADWQGQDIPQSCCTEDKMETPTPDNYCTEKGYAPYKFQEGCYQKMKMKVESNVKILIGVGIGIAFIEIAGIILAFCLAQAIKNEGTTK